MRIMWGIGLTDWAKDHMTATRTKELQNFYGIKYAELWDEERLKELWVKEKEIEEIIEIRWKELAYKDTVGYELWEGVIDSPRFKKLQEFYWITIEDTQDEKHLIAKWLAEDDIEFILWKRIKSKKKTNGSTKQWAKRTVKNTTTATK